MHPFRKLRESGAHTATEVEPLLSENIVFHSPALVRAVEGRKKAAAVFAVSPNVRKGKYIAEHRLDDRTTFLRWAGEIDGHEIESLEVLVDNDDGLIVERTIAYRPLPAVEIFRNAMRPMLADVLSDDYWEYPSK
jgi:hypothetical protein